MPHLSTRVLQGLLTLLLTLFGLLLVTFALSAFSPVDRVLQIVGDHASQSTYDQVRHQLGLDRPLPVQFWHYLQSLAHGDLGTASATGQPVLQDLLHAFPATLELATLALIIGTILGVIAGVLCARYAGSPLDLAIRTLTLLGNSVPIFWLGLLMLALFYAKLQWSAGPGRLDDIWQFTVEPRTGFALIDTWLSGDREVVAQYIPHGRIARDFASYLELYYKYQAHYQIDEALSGRRSEALLEQAARAPFDEKLSVISLVLAKLNVEFRKTGKMEDGLELLFEKLKAFKEQLAEAGDGTPVQRLTAFTREVREEYEGKKQAGLLTRAQIHRYEDICGTLDQYLLAAGEAEAQDGETLFGMLAARFGEGREQYEDQCRAVLQMVEYAFDLMEGAFGDSQEMVIFITELNTSYDAVRFLEENPCERYHQYNRKLLFEDREADIKRKLERLL